MHSFIFPQLEAQKKEGKKEDKPDDKKAPATWRWEKQDLEKQLKESKKKYDDIHADLKRQQFKWKLAGDDLARVSCNLLQSELCLQKG